MIRRPPRPTPFPNPTLFRSRSKERPYAHDPRADGAAPLEPDVQFVPRFMDPIGLALDNFDVTAKWRERENGMPLDTRGDYYDGTPVTRPAELTAALLKRPVPLGRTFTENLMAYALGRRREYFDMPAIRQIAKSAEAN